MVKIPIIDFGISEYLRNNPNTAKEERERSGKVCVPESGTISPIEPEKEKRIERAKSTIFDNGVILNLQGSPDSLEELLIVWIGERREWVGIFRDSWCESSTWGWDSNYSRPYELNKTCIKKILEAYDLTKADIDLNEVARTSPVKMEVKSRILNLKREKEFSEIPTFERVDYTAFWEYREDEPNEKIYCHKEKPFEQKGIRVYREDRGYYRKATGSGGHDPHDYPEGKSSELYLLENGALLECEVNNQRNETPMDPSTHTTIQCYILTRTKKRMYETPDLFMEQSDTSQLKDLLKKIDKAIQSNQQNKNL